MSDGEPDYSDRFIKSILDSVRSIAVIGASANTRRPSYFATVYLRDAGYKMFPINPGHVGKQIAGQTAYASLADLPETVDMVQLFRRPDTAPQAVEDAVAHRAKIFWMQLGIKNYAAAQQAEDAGLTVVMNRCPKIEHSRLNQTIKAFGVNPGVISTKRKR